MNRAIDLIAPGVAFLIYTNAPSLAHKFHGVPLLVAAVVPLLLCVPIARDVLLRGERLLIPPAFALLIGLLTVQFLGALFSILPEESMSMLLGDATELMLIYLLVSNAVRTPETFKGVIAALVAAGAFLGALSGHQQLTGNFQSNYGGFSQVANVFGGLDMIDGQPRLAGPVGEKNRYAQIMAMLIPLALFLGLAARSRLGAVAAWAGLALIMMGWALAFSRGAAVGVGLMVLIMIAMGLIRMRHIAVAALGFVVAAAVVPSYGHRVLSIFELAGNAIQQGGVKGADGATRGRATEMIAAVLVFVDHPIIGVGPGMNQHHYVKYARIAGGGKVRAFARRSHSLYLGLAAETGAVGLILFFAMVGVTFRDLRRARQRHARDRPDLATLMDGLTLALVMYFTTSIFLHAAYIRYFWLIMGLAAGASYMQVNPRSVDAVRWLVTRLARAS